MIFAFFAPSSALAMCGTMIHESTWPVFSAPMIAPTLCSGTSFTSLSEKPSLSATRESM